MLAQFQSLYPTGSLTSELVQIDRGKYIVRSSVEIEGVTRATGMAAAETIEEAEDKSRVRALMVLGINETQPAEAPQKQTQVSGEANLQVLPNRSLTAPVVGVKEHPNPSINSAEVMQAPPPNQTTTNPTEVRPISEPSPPPEVFSAPDDSDIYIYDQEFNKPLPIPTSNEPEIDTPIENPIMSDYQPQVEEETTPSKVTPLSKSSTGKTTKKTTKTSTSRRKKKAEPIDLSEVIAKTDVEMERLGWTPQQGREYLIQTYGKRGRTLLTEEELLDFLKYLESLPAADLMETDPLAGF